MIHPFSLFRIHHASKKRRSILYTTLSLVLFSAISSCVYAGTGIQLYRYKNENGSLVLTQTLPAQYADKGYDILNEKGRLIKTVPPALTPEEIRIRDAQIERERLALIEKKKQDAIDDELKLLYSHPNDAVRVLNRNFLDIQSVIEIKRSKINNLQTQIIDEESNAANLQRKGLSVGEEAIEKLRTLNKDIENTHTDIQELLNKLDLTNDELEEKIKRLEIITGHPATDYPAVLEAIQLFKDQSSSLAH